MFKKREKRKVRHQGDPDYSVANYYDADEVSLEPPKRKRHPFWKFLGFFLLLALLLGGALAVLAYLYVDTTVLKGEKEGRINVMVLGVDDTASLSDTIMILNVDTKVADK